jgi:hypothetical protein
LIKNSHNELKRGYSRLIFDGLLGVGWVQEGMQEVDEG